jgi:hypothetical protein
MLAEANQEIIVFDPVLFWEFLSERELCFLRRRGIDVTPTVGNSMHMRVHANARLAITECYNEVSGFPADTFEL